MVGLFVALLLHSFAFADFNGTGVDQDLTITLKTHVGTKPATRGRYLIRAHLHRQGEESSFNCIRGFRIVAHRQHLFLQCSKHVGSPDHEDEEALSFNLRWSRTRSSGHLSISDVHYVGDGSYFSKELYTLLGSAWRQRLNQTKALPLTISDRNDLKPFTSLSSLLETSYILLGRKALVEQRGLTFRLPVKSIYATVSPDFKASVFAILETKELDGTLHLANLTGPALLNLNDWNDNDLLLGLNIN